MKKARQNKRASNLTMFLTLLPIRIKELAGDAAALFDEILRRMLDEFRIPLAQVERTHLEREGISCRRHPLRQDKLQSEPMPLAGNRNHNLQAAWKWHVLSADH